VTIKLLIVLLIMRDKNYRRHQDRRIKNKHIQRLRDESRSDWGDQTDIDWFNLLDHLNETEYSVFFCYGKHHVSKIKSKTDDAYYADRLIEYLGKSKQHNKCHSWFKRYKSRKRRAKEIDRMRHEDYENIPQFKRHWDWDWD